MKKNNGIANTYVFMKKIFIHFDIFLDEITLFDVPWIKNNESTLSAFSLFYENKTQRKFYFRYFYSFARVQAVNGAVRCTVTGGCSWAAQQS